MLVEIILDAMIRMLLKAICVHFHQDTMHINISYSLLEVKHTKTHNPAYKVIIA